MTVLETGNETIATGHWIITYRGAAIEPLDPDPEHIHIEDIAHSLANQCRFTGHVRRALRRKCWIESLRRVLPQARRS